MTRINMDPLLRAALGIDALASGAMGLLLSALPTSLADLFALPEPLLRYTGAFLIAYAVFVAVLASRGKPLLPLLWIVIVGNAIWVVDSLLLLASQRVTPTPLGYVFVIAQALAV